jgi:pimeloyl-ACP methyl ester carboxylesterase
MPSILVTILSIAVLGIVSGVSVAPLRTNTLLKKLPWKPEGYETWTWRNNKINYVDVGGGEGEFSNDKPPLVLIHGFGASVYHWRYNIPALSEKFHVYAIDLLGFGLSDKPVQDYSAEIWRDQVVDFIKEVVGRPCAVAGNSLGGFTALYASAEPSVVSDKLITACVLLNAAGRFRNTEVEAKEEPPVWKQNIINWVQRVVIGFSFIYTKQPQRVEQVLKQVYPVDNTNVDKELVESIVFPAQDPNAAEVFYRVIKKNGNGPDVYVDDLLTRISIPVLLLWGEKDPWIRPLYADRIQALYSKAVRVSIDAGHCPHDESPNAVNEAIINFL